MRVVPLPVVSAPEVVGPPSPESGVDSSREDSPGRESIVVRSLGTSGLAELDVEEPAEEPSSAGSGPLGGDTESVLPLTASEPLRRPACWLLLAHACAVESPDAAAGTAPEVALEVSAALVHPPASGAVPGAVASVPVEVVPEGAAALVHPPASGAVPGAVASVPVEVVPEGAGTSVLGSVAPIAVPEVSDESVAESDASAAFAEVSASAAGTAAPVVVLEAPAASAVGTLASAAVPEVSDESVAESDAPGAAAVTGGAAAGGESVAAEAEDGAASIEAGGARSSARAVGTKNDAQPRAPSNTAVQPRTRSHRWSARTVARCGTPALPSRWRQSCFEPRSIAVDT
jgi:hypothetical protein